MFCHSSTPHLKCKVLQVSVHRLFVVTIDQPETFNQVIPQFDVYLHILDTAVCILSWKKVVPVCDVGFLNPITNTMLVKPMLHQVSKHNPRHRQSVVQLCFNLNTQDTLKHRLVKPDNVVADKY